MYKIDVHFYQLAPAPNCALRFIVSTHLDRWIMS